METDYKNQKEWVQYIEIAELHEKNRCVTCRFFKQKPNSLNKGHCRYFENVEEKRIIVSNLNTCQNHTSRKKWNEEQIKETIKRHEKMIDEWKNAD